ncbi:MAG: hypothetical protein NZ839_00755 [Endomicrobia bacterium]|nr:hypothetical protein [Endomicrobiia bacterium]MCX7715989.1 hypothetical protein [Endomicrobiia bacterium]
MKYFEFDKDIEKILDKNKIFFFYGENTYFMLDIIDKIQNLVKLEKEFVYCWEVEPVDIMKKLSTLSLFTPKNMIVLRHFEVVKKSFKQTLIDFLKNYNGQNLLFILYEQKILQKGSSDDAVIEYLFNNYISVEFNNLTQQEIINEFIPKKVNFTLTKEAEELLIDSTGNDLWLLSNELEKLSYFISGKKQVTEEDVSKCCVLYETAEIKQLIENIITNNFQQSLAVINLLLTTKKVSEVFILASLYKFFRKNFVYKKIPIQKICKILKELQNADLKLKTTSQKRYILESCILRLTKIYNE